MQPPLFVRPLAEAERAALRQGLRCPDAFTLRRCPILLASNQGQRPTQGAAALGCRAQTVRDALHAFAAEGLGCRRVKPKTPKTIPPAWPRGRDEDLRALRHPSPRPFGKPTSLWTLPLAAPVCHQKSGTPRLLRGATIRRVLKRLGVGCKRAQHGLTSPDPPSARNKKGLTG